MGCLSFVVDLGRLIFQRHRWHTDSIDKTENLNDASDDGLF